MVATDTFVTQQVNLGDTVDHVALVTPSDVNELTNITRGVSFAAEGALKVVTRGGETVVIPSGALCAGVIHPLRVKKIFATGTGATGIVAYY